MTDLPQRIEETRDDWIHRSMQKEARRKERRQTLRNVAPRIAKGLGIAALIGVLGSGILGASYVISQQEVDRHILPQIAQAEPAESSTNQIASQSDVMHIVPGMEIPRVTKYRGISVSDVGEKARPENNLGLITGWHRLQDIPFEIGYAVSTGCNYTDYSPRSYTISADHKNPSTLHFLVQSGGGTIDHRGEQIGMLEMYFSHGKISRPLVLGNNIRDWSLYNSSAVRDATNSNLYEAYRGTTSTGVWGRMDIYSVDVPEDYGAFTKAVLTDTSLEKTPCVYLLSAAIEYTSPDWANVSSVSSSDLYIMSQGQSCFEDLSGAYTTIEEGDYIEDNTLIVSDINMSQSSLELICRSGSVSVYKSVEDHWASYTAKAWRIE